MPCLVKAQIAAQLNEIAGKRIFKRRVMNGGNVPSSDDFPKSFRAEIETFSIDAEGPRNPQEIVRRRPRLPGYVAVELLPVEAVLATKMRDRRHRRAGMPQVHGKWIGVKGHEAVA